MAFTYDPPYTSTLNMVRMAIGDTDDSNANKQLFMDEEINALISAYGSDVHTVAGEAMLAIGANAAKIAVACNIAARDFVTDRKQVAKECREAATAFFNRADTATVAATEVAVEDEDQTRIGNYIDSNLDLDLGPSDLND